jgi:hypothetical protein
MAKTYAFQREDNTRLAHVVEQKSQCKETQQTMTLLIAILRLYGAVIVQHNVIYLGAFVALWHDLKQFTHSQ